MAPVRRTDPYSRSSFIVQVNGETIDAAYVTPPGGEAAIVYYRSGSDPSASRPMRGGVSHDIVTIRRGYSGNTELYQWWQEVRLGIAGARRNVIISLLDETRKEVARWRLQDAFPSSHRFEPLDATSSEPVVEVIELVYSDYELEL
jgi:phage tail-like protein